jgi:hypothetical protein
MTFPRARTDHLVIQELPDETLVFDHLHHKAHCLNRTTTWVWKHCDGQTDLAGLARLFEHEAQASVLVQLALEQLSSRHLLETPVERGSAAQRRSPRANAAGSKPTPVACTGKPDGSSCGGINVCCSNTCMTCVAGGGTACPGVNCSTDSDCCSNHCSNDLFLCEGSFT